MNFLFNAKFIINQQQNERYYELLPECKSCKNKVKADDCFSCRCFYCQWWKKCVEMKNVKEGCSRCKTKPKIGNLKKNYGLIKVFEQMEKHEYSKDGQILKEVIPKSSKMVKNLFICLFLHFSFLDIALFKVIINWLSLSKLLCNIKCTLYFSE